MPPFGAMRVFLAAQALNHHTVAAGISTHAALGKLPDEAIHTAMKNFLLWWMRALLFPTHSP